MIYAIAILLFVAGLALAAGAVALADAREYGDNIRENLRLAQKGAAQHAHHLALAERNGYHRGVATGMSRAANRGERLVNAIMLHRDIHTFVITEDMLSEMPPVKMVMNPVDRGVKLTAVRTHG